MVTKEGSLNILAAPTTGPLQHCQLLRGAREELSPFVEAEILGKGVAALVRKLDDAKGVFSKLDSESDERALSEGDMLEAVWTADEYFCKRGSNQKIKDLIVGLRKSGVRLRVHSFLSHGPDQCGEGDPAQPEVSRAFARNGALHAKCRADTCAVQK